jgi:hypothetical protein
VKEWTRIGDGSLYHDLPAEDRGPTARAPDDAQAAYMASIEYSLRSVGAYLRRLGDNGALIVIVGNHQPRAPIAHPDRDPWAVPVHVLSRDPALIAGFAAAGYVEGITPDPGDLDVGLEYFLPHLYAVLERSAPAP